MDHESTKLNRPMGSRPPFALGGILVPHWRVNRTTKYGSGSVRVYSVVAIDGSVGWHVYENHLTTKAWAILASQRHRYKV